MKILEIVETPNPNARKVLLDGPIAAQTRSYFNPKSAQDDPVASRLFAIEGVRGVMLLGTFMTITKSPDVAWEGILAELQRALNGSAG